MMALNYSDVYLTPNYSELKSRAEADTSVTIKDFTFKLPIIPANMKSVIDLSTYHKYFLSGVIPIMHRFNVDNAQFLKGCQCDWKAISVGVKEKDVTELYELRHFYNLQPTCVCIDIAHGHSLMMKNMIGKVLEIFPNTIVIAGNVTTPDAVIDLQNWGASMIKVGIGPGQVCSTKNKTGFHVPMFTAIMQCAEVAKVPIIADGGIKENGDIVKALVAGADFVMVGGMLAACSDSPAEIIDGKKEYYGSASERNKGHNKNVEGFTAHLTPTNTIQTKLSEIRMDLQSAISYAGGKDLFCLNLSNVKYTTYKR
jgi:GMP reductase